MSFFTTANYGNWQFWGVYDTANGLYGDQKVAFDGYNKIIYVAEGVRTLDVKEDIYSAWKEWVLGSVEEPAASSWPDAISAIGGEPLNDTLNVGSTFFLENGWRIQPVATKTPYILTVNGNIYTREAGGNPFLFAEGVSVNLTRSNLVDQLVASSTLTEADKTAIAEKVWGTSTLDYQNQVANFGGVVTNIDSDLNTLESKVGKTLTKGEFLALK